MDATQTVSPTYDEVLASYDPKSPGRVLLARVLALADLANDDNSRVGSCVAFISNETRVAPARVRKMVTGALAARTDPLALSRWLERWAE